VRDAAAGQSAADASGNEDDGETPVDQSRYCVVERRRRKQTPEPVFGIIKSVMGFRQFLLRGVDCVRGEWSLVTMAWNIKRMYALSLG
jgi:hypothetical protein